MVGDLEEKDVDIAVGHDLSGVATAVALGAAGGHGDNVRQAEGRKT